MADQNLQAYVEERSAHLGLSRTEVCRRAGISRQTLLTITAADARLPTLNTVISLARVLQVHPIRLLQIICDAHVPPSMRGRGVAMQGDLSAFVRDVTFADGEVVMPGQRFVKTWKMQNVGQVVWQDRSLQCMDEDLVVHSRSGESLVLASSLRPTNNRIEVPTTHPGETVLLSAEFTAPMAPGTVMSYWKSFHADGSLCFPDARGLWVKVLVMSLTPARADEHDRALKSGSAS